ncbi:SAM-dependent methyltransferase [Pelagibacterium lentulum]|uniref:Methyltransferase n=1 Tax=Pelagibacterium lentulum TaxID=2029865 RepID=A0A916R4T0_9HYPH|nr:SAM-dependent methyltransferase [Pelagibacterium lentulum]GGA34849.1 methyltransferase [Pelagibacterium lentulum]
MSQTPRIFDRALVARRIERLAGHANFIHELVAADLHDRLAPVTRDFQKALIIGPDARALPAQSRSGNGPIDFERVSSLVPDAGFRTIDPEHFDPGQKDYDLIVSLLDMQVVNNVPGFLDTARAHLAPDGLFIAALIGGRSLTELRDAWLAADVEMAGGVSPRVAPMIDVRDAGGLLQRAGFALPVTDLETHVVRYATPFALFDELRGIGATNPLAERGRGLTTPARLARAAQIYAERYADADGRVRATLEILWLSGWAPHESQQKPLRPGSAQKSLRDVLGDKG